jgi:hypothetical protein
MTSSTKTVPRRIGGCLLAALTGLAAWVFVTAHAVRDPLKLMLEWELLDVFMRHDTHGWYRTVIVLTGLDVLIGGFTVVGAGWLALLVWRKAARFPAQVQTWLLAILAMRLIAWLFGNYLTRTIGIGIELPVDGLMQAVLAAALGIPYFRWSRRVRETFVNA